MKLRHTETGEEREVSLNGDTLMSLERRAEIDRIYFATGIVQKRWMADNRLIETKEDQLEFEKQVDDEIGKIEII